MISFGQPSMDAEQMETIALEAERVALRISLQLEQFNEFSRQFDETLAQMDAAIENGDHPVHLLERLKALDDRLSAIETEIGNALQMG